MPSSQKTLLVIVGIVVLFLAGVGAWYFVLRNTTVLPKTSGTKASTNAQRGTVTKNANAPATIVRPEIPQQVADDDRDGLLNSEETSKYGTNDKNPDTDADGLSDGQEVRVYHTNPLKADTDGDGKSDSAEIRAATDPNGPGQLLDLTNAIQGLNNNR